MGDLPDSNIVRLQEKLSALDRRVEDHKRELKEDLSSIDKKVEAVSNRMTWVALAVISAVITAGMRLILGQGGP